MQFTLLWTIVTLLGATCSGMCLARDATRPVPITILSGFLGAGKTTLLKRLLENDKGLRIAVIVNDMAEINVDSKLVATSMNAAGMVELQNGCACCSKSEELLSSVAQLVTLSDMRNESFDHIVVELSGIADPKSIRSIFQEAVFYNMPLMDRVKLDTMITMIDCSSFLDYLTTERTTSLEESPELYSASGKSNSLIPTGLQQTFDPSSIAENSISELLVAQTEIADVLLLNKVDSVSESHVASVAAISGALNPRATLFRTSYSSVPWAEVLGSAGGQGVAMAGVVDDHKDSVHAASCVNASCTDPSHTHSHRTGDHQSHLDNERSHSSSDDNVHSHDEHGRQIDCDKGDSAHLQIVGGHKTKTSEHGSDYEHSHEHSHSHGTGHGDIGSFVYRSRRPFHPGRLRQFLRHLPIKRGLPSSEIDPTEAQNRILLDKGAQSVLDKVVRSKGFAWLADSHVAALYWSQAGVAFELTCLGSWWATLPRNEWPAEAAETIQDDFDSPTHDEFNNDCSTVGDRRQEIVFIGSRLGDSDAQSRLTALLDGCVLDDEEWELYRENHQNELNLKERFQNPLELRIATY